MSALLGVRTIVRNWLIATGKSGGLTAAQVIWANEKGTRPLLPYLTVLVTVGGIQVGSDEDRYGISGGLPTQHTVGQRRGTVSINAYGEGALDWLERAHLQLRNPVVLRDILDDDATGVGISLSALGGITDLSALLDTQIEGRWLREYEVQYAISGIGDSQALVEAATIVVEQTFESDAPPGDFTRTITAT